MGDSTNRANRLYQPADVKSLPLCLAHHSQLAYQGHRQIADTLQEAGFSKVFVFAAQGSNAYLCRFETDESHSIWILTFRGTENDYKDILHDVTVFKRTADYRYGYRVHGGFLTALQHIWGSFGQPRLDDPKDIFERIGPEGISETICNNISENDTLYVTGHSLGGALGYLAAYYIHRDLPHSVSGLFTYGAPRLLEPDMAGKFANKNPFPIYRYVNAADIVPRVPPAVSGFRHTGDEFYITRKKGLLENPGLAQKFLDVGWSKLLLFILIGVTVYAAFHLTGFFDAHWINLLIGTTAAVLSLMFFPRLFSLMPISFLRTIKFRSFSDHRIQDYIDALRINQK